MLNKLINYNIMKEQNINSLKKEKKRWEKSITTPDGTTKRMEVREIENGFIARMCVHNYKTEPYMEEEKEVYYEENPLKDLEPVEEPKDMLTDFFSNKTQLL